MSSFGAHREVAEQIIRDLPLVVIRMPHSIAVQHCTVVSSPWPGVRIDAARWAGRSVDLEILRTATGNHELTVFGFEHGRRTVLLHRAGLDGAELASVLTADLTRSETSRAAHG